MIDEDEEKVDNSVNDFLRKSLYAESLKVSCAIRSEATGRGYARIKKRYIGLPCTNTPLPLEYKLNQQISIGIRAVKKIIIDFVNGIGKEIEDEFLLGVGNHDVVKSEEDTMVMLSEI